MQVTKQAVEAAEDLVQTLRARLYVLASQKAKERGADAVTEADIAAAWDEMAVEFV